MVVDPRVSRMRLAAGIVLIVAYALAIVSASDVPIPVSTLCEGVEPWTIEWFLYSCWMA